MVIIIRTILDWKCMKKKPLNLGRSFKKRICRRHLRTKRVGRSDAYSQYALVNVFYFGTVVESVNNEMKKNYKNGNVFVARKINY